MAIATTLTIIAAGPAHAQWGLGLTVGHHAVSGHARSDDGTDIRPAGPMLATLAVQRRVADRWALRGSLMYGEDGVSAHDGEVELITHGLISGWGGSAQLVRRLAGNGGAPSLDVLAGVEVVRWSLEGERRTRPSVVGGLEGHVPLRGAWSATVRGELALGQSLWTDDELPPGYARRRGIRHGIALGISRGL